MDILEGIPINEKRDPTLGAALFYAVEPRRSFQQDHLSDLRFVLQSQPVEVNSRRESGGIESDLMRSGGGYLIEQGRGKPALKIIQLQSNKS